MTSNYGSSKMHQDTSNVALTSSRCCHVHPCTITFEPTHRDILIGEFILALAIWDRISIRLSPIWVGVRHLCSFNILMFHFDQPQVTKKYGVVLLTDPWQPILKLHSRNAPSHRGVHVAAAALVPVAFALEIWNVYSRLFFSTTRCSRWTRMVQPPTFECVAVHCSGTSSKFRCCWTAIINHKWKDQNLPGWTGKPESVVFSGVLMTNRNIQEN